jgi:hypothetical protein
MVLEMVLNRWIPIVLFLVSLAQLAPANLCLCSILPCISNASSSVSNASSSVSKASSHQGELFCAEEESCPCHEEKDVPPCRSNKNQSSHSCPFDQTTVVSDYAGPKKIVNYETGNELEFHDFNPIPQILVAQKESYLLSNHSLPPVPLYLRLQSILI